MSIRFVVRAGLLSLLVLFVSAAAGGAEEWNFSGVTQIKVKGVSGDVIIRPADGSQGLVQLQADVTPRDAFEPTVDQEGATLQIQEKWQGGSSSGQVEWTIYLPKGEEPRIQMSTASGSLTCEAVSVQLEIDTASGDIELTEVDLVGRSDLSTASGDYTIRDMTIREGAKFSTASGDINLIDVEIEEGAEFSTASGDIECSGCRGSMELSSASGNVIVKDSEIVGASRFSSASGDVSLYLDELPEKNLSASSASGKVMLDVADFGANFTLIMSKREDKGRIDCPFPFTSERTFERHHTYEEKRVERGSGGPEIELSTASGSVIVKN